MMQSKFLRLPSIRSHKFQPICTLRLNSRQNQKKTMPVFTNRWQRKLSLNSKESPVLQKNTFTKEKYSLLRKFSVGKLQSQKNLSYKNTKDNSLSDENEQRNSIQKGQNITEKALKALQNMSQIQKVTKLYRDEKIDTQKKQRKFDSIKCRCLVKQNVFFKKQNRCRPKITKRNSNEGKSKKLLQSADQFWDSVNQSLILQRDKVEQPSKDLRQLMEFLVTK